MKFIINDFDIPKAEKIFVDRIEPRQLFWQFYEQAKTKPMEEPLVLTYYGVGGIGKTALGQQLKKELLDRQPKAKFMDLDFYFVERKEPYRILALMRKKLSEQYNYSFPMFDVAYYSLLSQMGEEINKPEAQSFIGNSPVLSFVMNSAGFVPGADLITSVLQLADEGIALFRNSFSRKKPMLQKLMNTEPRTLLDELTIYFAADLRENLEKEKLPFVVFLDTYEMLVNEMAAIGDPLRNDLWLRGPNGIIQRLPGIIWVIGGREKLKWEQFNEPGHWDGVLHQYLLGTLSEKDTKLFLKNSGILDVKAQQTIYEQTEGLPVYLDLCVEQYFQEGTKNIAVGQNDLFERCTRYMNDQEKNILFLLACLGTWTENSAYAAGRQMPFDFSPVFYEKLLSFSFIQTNDGQNYTLMRQVGQVLRDHCPAAIRHSCMAFMVEKDARMKGDKSEQDENADTLIQGTDDSSGELNESMDVSRYMELLLSDVKTEDDLNTVLDNLEETLYELVQTYQFNTLYDYLVPLWELALGTYPETRVFARIQTFHSMGLYKMNEYADAETHGLEALGILRGLKGDIGAIELAIQNIAYQYCERFQFTSIPPVFEDLWAEITDALGTETEIAQLLAHTIGVAYDFMEQKEKAALWFSRCDVDKFQRIAEEYTGTEQEQEINRMKEQAEELWNQGDTDGAIVQILAAAERSADLFGEDHVNTLRLIENAASYFDKTKRQQDAIEMQEIAVSRYRELLGTHEVTTVFARTSLFYYLTAEDCGRLEEAFAMAEEVITDYEELFGKGYSPAFIFRTSVALSYVQYNKDAIIKGEMEKEYALKRLQEIHQDMKDYEFDDSDMMKMIENTIDMIENNGSNVSLTEVVDKKESPKEVAKKPREGVSVEAAIEAREKVKKCDAIWICGDKKSKRVKNALKKYGRDIKEEEVLLLIDGSFLGSGKEGAFFTKDKIFYKVIGMAGSAPIEDIKKVTGKDVHVCIYLRGKKEPVDIITSAERQVAKITRAFLGL